MPQVEDATKTPVDFVEERRWNVGEGIVALATAIGREVGSDLLTEASLAALRCNPVVDDTKARDELGYRARPSAATIRDLVADVVATGQLDRRTAPRSKAAATTT